MQRPARWVHFQSGWVQVGARQRFIVHFELRKQLTRMFSCLLTLRYRPNLEGTSMLFYHRRLLTGTAVMFTFLLSACGSDSESSEATAPPSSAESTTTAEATTSKPTPTPTPTPSETTEVLETAQIGDTREEGGVKLTLNSFEEVSSVDVNQSGFETGSGFETITQLTAEEGAKLFRADTTIENTDRTSMDLTCSFEVDIKVLSDKNQEYIPLDNMYEVVGNPGCNDQLQPGFSAEMSWIFKLPSDSTAIALFFVDPIVDDQFALSEDFQIFQLDPNYTLTLTTGN